MKLVSLQECQGRTPPHHFDMRTFPLVERQAGGEERLAVSLSYYLPGGGAEYGPQPVEVVFYLLDGELTIQKEDGELRLRAGEALHISAGEQKGIRNDTRATAALLVIACVPPEFP